MIDKNIEKEIIRLHKRDNLSYQEIANSLGISKQAVYRVMKKYEISSNLSDNITDIINYCNKHYGSVTVKSVAEHFNMPYINIYKLLKRHNIQLKSKKDILYDKLKTLDTNNLSLEEIYTECKDIVPNTTVLKNDLVKLNLSYKR